LDGALSFETDDGTAVSVTLVDLTARTEGGDRPG
jgi:hypothetical protein